MDDDAILGLYLARSEEAIAETAGKYGSYCQAVARRILAQPQDCEECVNDAYHRVWNAIPPQKPQHLRAFLARIVRNLALDRIRHDGAQKRGSLQVPWSWRSWRPVSPPPPPRRRQQRAVCWLNAWTAFWARCRGRRGSFSCGATGTSAPWPRSPGTWG